MAGEKETTPSATAGGGPCGRFAALWRLAARALFVERLWPPLAWALAVVVLFLAVSWLGLWLFAPREIRVAGVVLFALALAAALAPLVRLRWPKGRDVAARLDRDAAAEHRPATSLADSLANDQDQIARALWDAHQARLARALDGVRVAPPAPGMARRDPFALRFAVALIAFAAAVTAGPELYGRFAAAFDWRSGPLAAAAAGSRIDAWIDPPPYAGRPPIVIDLKSVAPQRLPVFEDSTLIVRGEPAVAETRVEGAVAPADPKAAPQSPERRWTIHGDGKATILRGGAKIAEVAFAVTPAGAPSIKLTEQPLANLSGSLTLAYKIDDRYGVTSARAEFALPHDPAKPAPRSLAQPPQAALALPSSANGVGDGKTTADLSEHPWAGARVRMTLTAVSVSGKTGSSEPVEVTLPERLFRNPLARALVEERRDLILDPDHAPPRVSTALTGLGVAPELFETPASIYLGLKEANSRLARAKSDADFLDVAALLWAMALQVEDGDATQAERDLRAAEQALREALQRGASEEELKRLMQNLREAAQRFASEMAKNAQESAQESQEQAQDLDKLMDELEDAARNGTREEAEAMLDQMQEMFENMRGAESGEESAEERALKKQIDELSKLLRDQQALRDDTFKSDQRDQAKKHRKRHPPPGQNDQAQGGGDNPPSADGQDSDDSDQPDAQGAPNKPSLEERQQALRDRLAELQRKLKSLGMKGEKGFDEAQKDMREAEGDLKGEQGSQGGQPGEQSGQGPGGKSGKGAAVDAQGRALEAMREGAEGMQKQMQQGQGQGRGKGYSARRQRPGEREGDDPLGRGREGNHGHEDGTLRETGGGTERARRVLEELRRRLADPSRPRDERDYLERLTKPN